jgi:hypothetical protein
MIGGQQVAMIEEVGVGARDVGRPVLWFTVSGDGWGALQIFELDEPVALDLLSSVRDAHDLNGRVCVVDSSGAFGSIRFVKLLPAARRKS